MPHEKEIRTLPVKALEVRQDGDAPARIVGHAAVFNSFSDPICGFRERILPGAFTRALEERQDVRALVNHDPNLVLGRTKAGTLALEEDDEGLRVEIRPPDTSYARDLVESIRRGDVDQMSFGFVAKEEAWLAESGPDGEDVRDLIDLDLFDVSPVTYPAYPQTDVAVRSHTEWRSEAAGDGDPPAGSEADPDGGDEPPATPELVERELVQKAAEIEN